MAGYTMQPGDFIISTNTYGKNKIFAIYEGKDIYSSNYVSSTPNYSLLVHYEANPYRSYGPKAYDGPEIEIATQKKPCKHMVYIKENPTIWKKCTPEEKQEFIGILEELGYAWNDETWTLAEIATGEILTTIIRPKIEYNGQVCKLISDETVEFLKTNCKKEAEKIWMPGASASGGHVPGQPCYAGCGGYHNYEYDVYD